MFKWAKKFTVAMFTVATLAQFITYDVQANGQTKLDAENLASVKKAAILPLTDEGYSYNDLHLDYQFQDIDQFVREEFIAEAMKNAYALGYKKFGDRISERVGKQYEQIVLPEWEQALIDIQTKFDVEDFRFFRFTDDPTGGVGEKILHVYDERSGEDIIRLHVRRDQPPRQGYWFNFHYHLKEDNYQQHFTLASIFWDKDTPPNWTA